MQSNDTGPSKATPRQAFRAAIEAEQPVFAPLCLDALTARLTHELGFGAGYLSGGALGYAHAVSEALLTLTELADTARHLTNRSDLPIIVDGGVGFGDAVHMARTIWEIESTSAAAIEIEDQVAPKRVSHHRGIEHLVSMEQMCAKITQAVSARRDPDFLIIARTGAVRNESFDAAVDRANAYADAGADLVMLMPGTDTEWGDAPRRVAAPLAAITSLDTRTPGQWSDLGWRLIIDPFTAQVLALDAVRNAYRHFIEHGNTGHDRRDIFAIYREIPELAGLNDLYEIEDNTTEQNT